MRLEESPGGLSNPAFASLAILVERDPDIATALKELLAGHFIVEVTADADRDAYFVCKWQPDLLISDC